MRAQEIKAGLLEQLNQLVQKQEEHQKELELIDAMVHQIRGGLQVCDALLAEATEEQEEEAQEDA